LTFVVINAITVPAGGGEELERRFANRAGEVSKAPGFESFRLLRPANDEAGDEYFVFTSWAREEDFRNWMASPAFTRGHASSGSASGKEQRPVGTASRVLAYEVVQQETA
jgi:heme oxygenase (mycobilin-producing)